MSDFYQNGIITTLADFDVLSGPISDAVDQGIRVIDFDAGVIRDGGQAGALCCMSGFDDSVFNKSGAGLGYFRHIEL